MNSEQIIKKVVETLKNKNISIRTEIATLSEEMTKDEIPPEEHRHDPHYQRLEGKEQANEDTIVLINSLQATETKPAQPVLESDQIIDNLLDMLREDCVRLETELNKSVLGGSSNISLIHGKLLMVERYLVHLADQVAVRNVNRMLKLK